MFLSYFEYMRKQIDAVKDEPHFIKKYGRNFMRAFQEEMQYNAFKAVIDPSIEFNAELDRIENDYCFNEEMRILLSAVSPPVRWAVINIHSGLLYQSTQSPEAEAQVKSLCRLMMEDFNRRVELHPDPICKIDDEMVELQKELKVLLEKGDIK